MPPLPRVAAHFVADLSLAVSCAAGPGDAHARQERLGGSGYGGMRIDRPRRGWLRLLTPPAWLNGVGPRARAVSPPGSGVAGRRPGFMSVSLAETAVSSSPIPGPAAARKRGLASESQRSVEFRRPAAGAGAAPLSNCSGVYGRKLTKRRPLSGTQAHLSGTCPPESESRTPAKSPGPMMPGGVRPAAWPGIGIINHLGSGHDDGLSPALKLSY